MARTTFNSLQLSPQAESPGSRHLLTNLCATLLATSGLLQRLCVCPSDGGDGLNLFRPRTSMISMAELLERLAVLIPNERSAGALAESTPSLRNLKVHILALLHYRGCIQLAQPSICSKRTLPAICQLQVCPLCA